MADMNPSRVGAINNDTGTYSKDNALFLKVFAGEVLTAFAEANVMMDKHQIRSIQSGKSATFPVTGKASAYYHTPGNLIDGKTINHAEKVITIDNLLVAPAFIASIDEAKNHYDVRSVYSTEIGRALASQADRHVLQVAVLAARASATITGGNGGSVIYADDAGFGSTAADFTKGDDIARALYLAAQRLDEKDVPDGDRYFFVKPEGYYALVDSQKAINRDWNPDSNGSFAEGRVFRVAGIQIVKTNHLPSTNITSGVDGGDAQQKYKGDFSDTFGVVMHKSAVGTVKLLDLALEAEYKIEYQGTLMVAKYAMGHDVLRPESAIEISKATTP